jgi:DNA-binding transcriptional ArsR family regulator
MPKRKPSVPSTPQPDPQPDPEPGAERPGGEPPYIARRIDSAAMKAFAHPLRMAIYNFLTEHGSATATTLAAALDESTGQTSYHLRQLARHGFVEDSPGKGTGRERWWRPVGFSYDGVELAENDPALRAPLQLALQTQIDQRSESMRQWFARTDSEPAEWRQASVNSATTVWLTPAELEALTTSIMETIHEHTEHARERHAASDEGRPGERRVRVYLDAYPLATSATD